jgi:hypothetical protein
MLHNIKQILEEDDHLEFVYEATGVGIEAGKGKMTLKQGVCL